MSGTENKTDEAATALAGLHAKLEEFRRGSNWIVRRDAADLLTLAAREVVAVMRRGESDADPDVAHAARQALETLRQDFKDDPDAVERDLAAQRRAFSMGRGGVSGDATTRKMSGAEASDVSAPPDAALVEQWLGEMATADNGMIESDSGAFAVTLPGRDGRTQKVRVEITWRGGSGETLLTLSTTCGALSSKKYGAALRANARLSHGAFAVAGEGADEKLILILRRRLDGLTRESLIDDVRYLARKGDDAETQLQGGDVH